MDTEKWPRNALGNHSPGGGEKRAIDASKCGQGNRDGHDPGHDPQKLLSKSLGKKTISEWQERGKVPVPACSSSLSECLSPIHPADPL